MLHVPAEPSPVCGIKTNVNHDPIVPPASILLPTAQAALTVSARTGKAASPVNVFIPTARGTLTVYVVAVYRENIPPPPMLILVRTGKVV